jgi:RNA polymerase sigma factor (sigma-70 family)
MTLLLGDPDLLGRFRAGERKALATVYEFYARPVEAYVRRGLVGRCAAGEASATVADLVQEVFVHAFAGSARLAYDGIREYGRFLTAIASNALVDHLRRHRREEPVDPPQLEHLLDRDVCAEVDGSPWGDSRILALVRHYVAALPEREQAVYIERYVQDRSQLQAASALGLTRQQIRTLEQRVHAGLLHQLAHAKLTARSSP